MIGAIFMNHGFISLQQTDIDCVVPWKYRQRFNMLPAPEIAAGEGNEAQRTRDIVVELTKGEEKTSTVYRVLPAIRST